MTSTWLASQSARRVSYEINTAVSSPDERNTERYRLSLSLSYCRHVRRRVKRQTGHGQVEYRYNSDTAIPKGDWLGIIAWGEEPTADASVARTRVPEMGAGTVCCPRGSIEAVSGCIIAAVSGFARCCGIELFSRATCWGHGKLVPLSQNNVLRCKRN